MDGPGTFCDFSVVTSWGEQVIAMRHLDVQEEPSAQEAMAPVASPGHTVGLLAILAFVFAIGFVLQASSSSGAAVQASQSVKPIPRRIIPGLIESLVFD